MRMLLRTDEVAEADRTDYWRAAMRSMLKAECRVEARSARAFGAAMGVLRCGPATLVELTGSAFKATRLGPGEDGVVSIKVQLDGVGLLSEGRRSARLAPGDICIVPPDREIVAERLSDFRQVLVNLQATELDELAPGWRALSTVALSFSHPRVRPASELLRFVLDHHDALDAPCRDELGTTAMHLLGSLLNSANDGRAGDTPGPARSRVTAFHRQRIERFILEHLRDPELSVARVARELGLSRRYVHKLFEGEPANVMQWATAQRLRACQRDIATRGTRAISDVAYAWGFNNPSHFSRIFKRHFGVRPSDL